MYYTNFGHCLGGSGFIKYICSFSYKLTPLLYVRVKYSLMIDDLPTPPSPVSTTKLLLFTASLI